MPRSTGKRSVTETPAPTSGIGADGFAWRDVTVRGDKYHLREIDGEAYEKILKQSVIPGTDGERIDLGVRNKLMLAKSCTEPKLDPGAIGTMPFRKQRALMTEVVVLHFGDEDEDEPSVNVPLGILPEVLALIKKWRSENGEDEGEGKESSSEEDESSAT